MLLYELQYELPEVAGNISGFRLTFVIFPLFIFACLHKYIDYTWKRYQNEGRVKNLDFDRSVHTLIDFKSFMLTDNEM